MIRGLSLFIPCISFVTFAVSTSYWSYLFYSSVFSVTNGYAPSILRRNSLSPTQSILKIERVKVRYTRNPFRCTIDLGSKDRILYPYDNRWSLQLYSLLFCLVIITDRISSGIQVKSSTQTSSLRTRKSFSSLWE